MRFTGSGEPEDAGPSPSAAEALALPDAFNLLPDRAMSAALQPLSTGWLESVAFGCYTPVSGALRSDWFP